MPEPLLQAQIDIDAPVDKVWQLITDLRADARVEPAVPDDEGHSARCVRAPARSTSTGAIDCSGRPPAR